MSEDVNRLPKWAQMRLSRLEADVEYWKEKALSAAGELKIRSAVT